MVGLSATGYAGTVADGSVTLPAFDLVRGIDDPHLLPYFTFRADAKNGAISDGNVALLAFTLDA